MKWRKFIGASHIHSSYYFFIERLHGHDHVNLLVGFISLQNKVLQLKLINVANRPLDSSLSFSSIRLGRADIKLGERTRFTLNLDLQCLGVVQVDMGVAHGMNKLATVQIRDMCNHLCQQRIRCNVEWNTESHIARSLVKLA